MKGWRISCWYESRPAILLLPEASGSDTHAIEFDRVRPQARLDILKRLLPRLISKIRSRTLQWRYHVICTCTMEPMGNFQVVPIDSRRMSIGATVGSSMNLIYDFLRRRQTARAKLSVVKAMRRSGFQRGNHVLHDHRRPECSPLPYSVKLRLRLNRPSQRIPDELAAINASVPSKSSPLCGTYAHYRCHRIGPTAHTRPRYGDLMVFRIILMTDVGSNATK